MIEFTPREDCQYKYDYSEIFRQIALGTLEEKSTYKALVLDDLFFITYFVQGYIKEATFVEFRNWVVATLAETLERL